MGYHDQFPEAAFEAVSLEAASFEAASFEAASFENVCCFQPPSSLPLSRLPSRLPHSRLFWWLADFSQILLDRVTFLYAFGQHTGRRPPGTGRGRGLGRSRSRGRGRDTTRRGTARH